MGNWCCGSSSEGRERQRVQSSGTYVFKVEMRPKLEAVLSSTDCRLVRSPQSKMTKAVAAPATYKKGISNPRIVIVEGKSYMKDMVACASLDDHVNYPTALKPSTRFFVRMVHASTSGFHLGDVP